MNVRASMIRVEASSITIASLVGSLKMDFNTPPTKPIEGLVVLPFEEIFSANGREQRYLVESDVRQYVVDARVHKLLMALQAGHQTWKSLATHYSELIGNCVTKEEVCKLISKLPGDWFEITLDRNRKTPFWVNFELISAGHARPLTNGLKYLFNRPLAIFVIAAFLCVEALALPFASTQIHGNNSAITNTLLIICLLVTSFFHELGHLSACARSGGKHGGIGAGMYWAFPAFYADVTQAWRLPPAKRVLVDVGGLYFQCFAVIAIGAYALVTGSSFCYQLLWLVTFTMLHTLNPFFKFDGYWLLSDASGLTNLHASVRKSLATSISSLMKTEITQPKVTTGYLKPTILRAYVFLSALYLFFVLSALFKEVRKLATQYPDFISDNFKKIGDALHSSDFALALRVGIEIAIGSFWPACIVFFLIAMSASMYKRMVRLREAVMHG